jgi:hypothetical protein
MHIGRVHKRTIQNRNGRALIIDRDVLHKHPRSHFNDHEIAELLVYINAHRAEYPDKTTCFRAALEATGLKGRINVCYGAVKRYFDKAETVTHGNGESPVKRKYNKRQKPLVQEIKVNFCPQCGCNIHTVATGMAMAKLV